MTLPCGEEGKYTVPYSMICENEDIPDQDTEKKNDVVYKKKFKCTLYSFTANFSSGLKYINSFHKHLKSFKCFECDFAAIASNSLNRHIDLVHKKLRPFKCDYAKRDYVAANITTLTQHIDSVHKHIQQI